ncbi:MAG: hypothetical protein PVF91_12050 [Chromatiales bacterium]|jgi:hypothetical protein
MERRIRRMRLVLWAAFAALALNSLLMLILMGTATPPGAPASAQRPPTPAQTS